MGRPVKIAGGLLISALICLPSLYIFTCLSGSQARLAEMFGLVGGLLMLMTILLIGFAPVAWLFSQSTDSVAWMGALHLVFWFIATFFGLRFLKRVFRTPRRGPRGPQHLDRHFHAGGRADDDRPAAYCRHSHYLPAGKENVLRHSLGAIALQAWSQDFHRGRTHPPVINAPPRYDLVSL